MLNNCSWLRNHETECRANISSPVSSTATYFGGSRRSKSMFPFCPVADDKIVELQMAASQMLEGRRHFKHLWTNQWHLPAHENLESCVCLCVRVWGYCSICLNRSADVIDSWDRLPAKGPCWMSARQNRVHVQHRLRLMEDIFVELTDYE